MSERKLVIDGNGVTVSQGSAAIGNITEITLPGWAREEIDDTALDNVGVTSYILANLRDWSNLEITVKMGGETAISADNTLWTIGFPNGASLAFYGQVSSQGTPSIANGSSVLLPLSVKVTNVSGAAIVAPVFTSGGLTVTSAAVVTSGGQA